MLIDANIYLLMLIDAVNDADVYAFMAFVRLTQVHVVPK